MELNELIRGGKSGNTKFISGFKRRTGSVGDVLTISAPNGQKVVLTSMARDEQNGTYTITIDSVAVITNESLTYPRSPSSPSTGSFYVGISGAESPGELAAAVPMISGKSITITNITGLARYTYSYLFVEDK